MTPAHPMKHCLPRIFICFDLVFIVVVVVAWFGFFCWLFWGFFDLGFFCKCIIYSRESSQGLSRFSSGKVSGGAANRKRESRGLDLEMEISFLQYGF